MTDLQKAAQQLMEAVLGFAYHGKAERWEIAVKAYFAALEREQEQEQEQEPNYEIKPPNADGETLCGVHWIVETPAGWVGAWNREALEQFVAPPRREWQGLTEEEIQSMHDYYVKRLGPIEFACAIEAKLKEKNHD